MRPVFGMITIQADERGRIRIPASYRASFGDTIYGFKNKKGNYLSIFGEDTLNDMLAKLSSGINVEEDESVEDARDIYRNIFELQEDKQGRFTLAPHLREELRLSKELVFIGMGKKIEMWDKTVYDEYINARKGKSAGTLMVDGKPLSY